MKPRIFFIITTLLAFLPCSCTKMNQAEKQPPREKYSFEEKLLVRVPEEFDLPDEQRPVFSPNGSSVAFIARQGNKSLIIVGDKRGPEFDLVSPPVFSPDGSNLAYWARQGHKQFVAVGGKTGLEFRFVKAEEALVRGDVQDILIPPVFSPDGHTVAYKVSQGRKSFIVVGENKHEDFKGNIYNLTFSPDGSKVAYKVWDYGKHKQFIVVGEKKTPEYERVGRPVFNQDGSTVAYWAKRDNKFFIVVGDERELEYDEVGTPSFSPSGNKVAYTARQGSFLISQGRIVSGGKWFVVIGGGKGPEYDMVLLPVYSPDGSKVAYWAFQNDKYFMVIGDTRGPEFGQPVFSTGQSNVIMQFSPDVPFVGYHEDTGRVGVKGIGIFASVEYTGPPQFGNPHISLDAPFFIVGQPVFSVNGSQVVYSARQGDKQFVVIGEKRGPKFDRIGNIATSPDGANVAYCAKRGKKWLVIAGDREGPEFDDVWAPVFNSDGSKVAYGARQGKELWWKVVIVQ